MDARELAGLLREQVAGAVPRGSRVALIDFPTYANAGDSALWVAQRQYLAELDVDVVYSCDHHGLSLGALRRALGSEGMVLFQSGGNFGDVYPWFQNLREHVVRAMGDHAIVQLPQTMQFERAEALERAKEAYEAHGGVRLLLRDTVSLERARETFDLPSSLCPDSAFALRPDVPRERRRDVLWLSRKDAERTGGRLLPAGHDGRVEVMDWLTVGAPGDLGWSRAYIWQRRASEHVIKQLTRRPRAKLAMPLALATFDALAGMRLDAAVEALGSSRVVVTDRLHGHILCLLLGVPHVLVETGYGKIQRFAETWGTTSSDVRFEPDAAAALRTALQMVDGGS